MATQVILLERVENLGQMGDVVSVKPGYARNYLLPQSKALRASKENIAYFDAQKKTLEAENEKKRKEAEKLAAKIKGVKVPLIRAASEAGQLYGSVNSRDIAEQLSAETKLDIQRSMVVINQNYKTIGLFDVDVVLHPEVKERITVNIARNEEEAKIQAETGKALIAEADENIEEVIAEEAAAVEEGLEEVLEEGALEAQKEKQAEAEAKAADEAKKAEEKAAKKAAKEEAKAADASAEAAENSSETADADEVGEEKVD